jgi:replicative DNA helicase
MALLDSTVRRLPEPAAPEPRVAPHNLEAEQALLGAILVNNEAFYRVSDFLEPGHFFEPLHQQLYELASNLIRAGKIATPVTLKTFLPSDVDIGGMNASQYLARLAAEATTVINAADYGHTITDLSVRRNLIRIGEDMVNQAFDAPVDFAPREQIEDAERKLYDIAETGRFGSGFQRFSQALTTAVDMAARAYQRDGKLSGIATGLKDLDAKMGGLQSSDLIIIAGRPGMGKTALATNIAYNIARAHQGETRWKCRPSSSPPVSSPSAPAFRRATSAAAASPRPISSRSRTSRSNCNACRSMSTRPAAWRLRSLPREPAGSSGRRDSTCW